MKCDLTSALLKIIPFKEFCMEQNKGKRGYMGDVPKHPNPLPTIFFLAGDQRRFGLCIIMVKNNILKKNYISLASCLNVRVWIDRLVVWHKFKVQNSFVILPDWQHNFFFVNSCFWCHLGWYYPRSFPINVAINYPLFVAGNYTFQKWINFIAFQKRIANVNALHQMNFLKLERDP